MGRIQAALRRFLGDDDGATVIEYAILAASIIAVLVLVIYTLGVKTSGLYERVRSIWDSVNGS